MLMETQNKNVDNEGGEANQANAFLKTALNYNMMCFVFVKEPELVCAIVGRQLSKSHYQLTFSRITIVDVGSIVECNNFNLLCLQRQTSIVVV